MSDPVAPGGTCRVPPSGFDPFFGGGDKPASDGRAAGISLAGGLFGQLGLYEVEVDGQVRYMTLDEISSANFNTCSAPTASAFHPPAVHAAAPQAASAAADAAASAHAKEF